MSNALIAPHFQTPENAREWLENLRWPEGPVCSHCGTVGHAYKTKKPGWYRCAEKECRKDFTVNKWLMAFYLLNASKKGMSAHQLHRALKLDYKSAWFMCHRIREAMRAGNLGPLGGGGGIVEADETYFGPTEQPRVSPTRGDRPYKKGSRGPRNKRPIVTLVERGGNVRSFHVPVADKESVVKIVRQNIKREARLHTDESNLYSGLDRWFGAHETVKHSAGEYVRGDVHTNSAEGYFSIFKRGMRGVYQHCKEKHLHRYLAEFDHRYNHRVALGYSDIDRTLAAIRGIEGKRLMYRQPD
jgi:ISXO2-like transposase domain/Transposase zinc-ribbon domain